MSKLSGESLNITEQNLAKLQQLFPEAFTEGKIDFAVLKQLLGDFVDDADERYSFKWNGKGKALRISQTPSLGTLRPCKEESKDWDTTKNLYIEGDNLEVLKLLQKSYYGKIKMIYIDPPYNTGKDFVYKDDFRDNIENYKKVTGQSDDEGHNISTNTESNGRFHTDWLNMMYPRLRLARTLLSEDGVIFISIDENEIDNLKKIGLEIFGSDNYAGEIIWKNSSKNDQAYISIQHEYIICFVKDKQHNPGVWLEAKEGTDEIFKAFNGFHAKYGNDWKAIHKAALEWYKQFPPSNPIYDSKHYSWMDAKGVYFPDNISGPNFGQYVYDIVHPTTGKNVKAPASGWRFPESTMKDKISRGEIHFGDDETTVPNNKTYLKNTLFQSIGSVKYQDGRVASKQLTTLMGGTYFTNPKDVNVLKWLMNAVGLSDGDIVLDFFAGSAATAQAVMELNSSSFKSCHFIMVQIPENLNNTLKSAVGSSQTVIRNAIQFLDSLQKPHVLTAISEERIRRAGQKILSEISQKSQSNEGLLIERERERELAHSANSLDVGFKVFKLDSSNLKKWNPQPEDLQLALQESVENFLPGRTELDVAYEILLKMGFDLSVPIEEREAAGQKVYIVGDGALMICLGNKITLDTAKEIINLHKEYKSKRWEVVFQDNGFASDTDKTNIKETLKAAGLDENSFVCM